MKRITKIKTMPELNLSILDGYVGKSCATINSELCLGVNTSAGKSFTRLIIERMIKKCGIEIDPQEYEYKMIRIDEFGRPKNPSPFKTTDYLEIIHEEWESSDFKKLLGATYIFFIVTYGPPGDSIFKGYVLHDFTHEEMESAKKVWIDTRDKIREGTYDEFLTEKDTGTFFFKTHASSVFNLIDAPGGGQEIVRSFWMSRALISRIISLRV